VARQIAELVCVVPGKAEPWLFEPITHPTEAAIEDCLGIGMLRHDDASLGFRHELARRALEDSLSEQRRQLLHAKVLEVLAARSDVPVARLAHHADGARNGLQVLRYAPLAGAQAASVGSHREAAAHYQAALHYADDLEAIERARLLEALSYECYLTGDHPRAFAARRSALEIWRAQNLPLKEGDALRWLSRLFWFMGTNAQADEYWHALGCPYEHACLLAWHGTETEQRRALTSLEQLGAAPAARLLRRQMRVRGVRRIPRGSRPSTQGHPLGLTRREAEILGLLQHGLRSASIAKRLFVSPKTVEHHVSAILAKLGVSSRAEAVALVRGQTKKNPT
jgi:DNA-binding CsgD family transcriptional regulator